MMGINGFAASLLVLGLAACNQAARREPAANGAANQPEPPQAANETANVTLSDDRTPIAEPNGPIDPKSAEAAGQVVQHYGALIEQKRFAEAGKLWGDPSGANAFAVQLRRYSRAHLEIGKLGEMEGAAGSSYVTVPAVFYGKDRNGADLRRSADVILRRVNDVPGSTDAERRWHIERIEWKNMA